MAAMRRLGGTIRTCRAMAASKTLTPSYAPSLQFQRRLHDRSFEQNAYALEGQRLTVDSGIPVLFSVPAILAGLFGVGLLEVAHADADEAHPKTLLPSESPSSHVDLEEAARKERQRLEGLLKTKGMQYGSYPRFTVAVKGQKITIKFQIPPNCEIPLLIANLVSSLGLKVEDHGAGSDMVLRAWDSAVAWQLTLSRPENPKESGGSPGQPDEGDLCVLLFRSLISSDKPEIEFIKRGSFSSNELDALASALQLAGQNRTVERKSRGDNTLKPSVEKSVASLEAMGVRIYGLSEPNLGDSKAEISWDNIAGYNQQKRDIEDTILLALQSPGVYDDIARGTRSKFESNRPRAVLFEGPPGTGKTSCARVIANQAGVPLLYVPLEVVMSKYYGESERLLGKVFSLANEIPNGAIIFLDEVDSFAVTRDNEMHEATRRILSVLLRQIDGFEQEKKVVVIAATNRKQDLDPALISRFDSMIFFGLPDQQTRQEIVAQYAKHLTKSELAEFAKVTEEMSGRDIRDVCQQAERRWASKIIRGQADKDGENGSLPPLQEYTESAMDRRRALLSGLSDQSDRKPVVKKPQLDLA
ncbi:cell division cycle protein 48 homolog [Rhododendron vialii]|uniref:cell division cycle protein 48 homolog n=1 Tax=Rhododendron vialii TaxID=182163 RepID=UPI00265F039C|nr:cell division cycle protein 48 homolog [Rhododendron vialii]XP_058200354.1 cell division cycle protein 48 homolog [Rhododendron vialii]XP_058200355.1 cell division cycle protein 48 homolog [Rhododendron vialii]XP_058200356.1 cell division cycle protein 48 homolog [Rhododendron vialii]